MGALDYDRLVQKLTDAFGATNVRVRRFEDHRKDPVAAFANEVGIDITGCSVSSLRAASRRSFACVRAVRATNILGRRGVKFGNALMRLDHIFDDTWFRHRILDSKQLRFTAFDAYAQNLPQLSAD